MGRIMLAISSPRKRGPKKKCRGRGRITQKKVIGFPDGIQHPLSSSQVNIDKVYERKTQMEQKLESIRHASWECKNHVLFIPKKRLNEQVRRELGGSYE